MHPFPYILLMAIMPLKNPPSLKCYLQSSQALSCTCTHFHPAVHLCLSYLWLCHTPPLCCTLSLVLPTLSPELSCSFSMHKSPRFHSIVLLVNTSFLPLDFYLVGQWLAQIWLCLHLCSGCYTHATFPIFSFLLVFLITHVTTLHVEWRKGTQ